MPPRSSLLLLLSFLIPYVASHGFPVNVIVDGKQYDGINYKTPSVAANGPIRPVAGQDPLYGANNPGLPCGQSSGMAKMTVDVAPGANLQFQWHAADNSLWPHNTGPIMTYMASCGDSGCSSTDASGVQWFKIAQTGKKSGSSTWFQADLMNGGPSSVSIPKNIQPGQYLIRHEIIALHLASGADAKGKAEFYPRCMQVNIGGNGVGAPTNDELVSFPGAYNDNDSGLWDKTNSHKFYDDSSYNFPGPPVAKFANSASAAAAGSPTSTKTCKTKKRRS